MLGPVTCGACGAKVREDRVRCLRCGAPLTAASAARRQLSIPVIAMVASVVALGSFFAFLAGRSGDPAAVATAVTATSGTAPATAAPASAGPPTASRTTPDPAFVAMEIARDGLAAYKRGDVAASVDAFAAAVEADPQNVQALNNLGQALVRAGRAREAIPYFDRAIAVDEQVWAYRFNRAKGYAALEEWGRAIADYRDAARLFPDDYATAFNLAKALQASGNLSDALTEYERAISLAPGASDFYLAYAFALESAKRPQDAAATYRRFLELEESAPQAEKIRARIAQLESQS